MTKTLKAIKVEGDEEELEELTKKLEKQGQKVIKLFGDPFVLES